MQGRITKVINMKPVEILGMIEEAAGTRMYETKKQSALLTIEKKQSKVDEINRILKDEITPTLERLAAQKTHYLKWSANKTECDRLNRFLIAYQYTQAKNVFIHLFIFSFLPLFFLFNSFLSSSILLLYK